MNPTKVSRDNLKKLTDLPNIGKSIAEDLRTLGIHHPQDLKGKCAYKLFEEICDITGVRQDYCLLDVFISVVAFIEGNEPKPWWYYTAERKAALIKRQQEKHHAK